jgi:hypothetical protein
MPKLRIILLLAVELFAFSFSYGQSKPDHDSNYYVTYPDKLTARIYLSQKFLKFTIPSSTQEDIEYKAQTKMNLGIGATWHNYSVNIFYGFAFLNKDTAKGSTKGLDLQLHLYPRKWSIDLLALFPRGYYIFPRGYGTNGAGYYYRPDIKLNLIGISAYQVPNKAKFSYRAAITQNEWQKISAGSLLYGGLIYHGRFRGDSSLVPKILESGFVQDGIKDIRFTAFGPGGGYAYTFVIKKHFFFTTSAVGNLNITFTTEYGAQKGKNATSVQPSIVAKAAVGYNSSTWDVSVNGLGSAIWAKGDISPQKYYLPVGAVRLVISRKFDLKKKH